MAIPSERGPSMMTPRPWSGVLSSLGVASVFILLVFASQILAQNGSPMASDAADVVIHTNSAQDSVNPIANAGESLTVYAGQPAVLNGTASSDNCRHKQLYVDI